MVRLQLPLRDFQTRFAMALEAIVFVKCRHPAIRHRWCLQWQTWDVSLSHVKDTLGEVWCHSTPSTALLPRSYQFPSDLDVWCQSSSFSVFSTPLLTITVVVVVLYYMVNTKWNQPCNQLQEQNLPCTLYVTRVGCIAATIFAMVVKTKQLQWQMYSFALYQIQYLLRRWWSSRCADWMNLVIHS